METTSRNQREQLEVRELLDLLTRYENYGQVHDRDGRAICRSPEEAAA